MLPFLTFTQYTRRVEEGPPQTLLLHLCGTTKVPLDPRHTQPNHENTHTKKGKDMAAALRALAETDVRDPIPAKVLLSALQTPPFVVVPGTFNTRDLGLLLQAGEEEDAAAGARIRPGFIFRTGGLEALARSRDGQAMLRDTLRVRRIFDLRSREEHSRAPDPVVEGVEGVWLGDGVGAEDNPMLDLSLFVGGEGEDGYVHMYMDVLDKYSGSFRGILASVRDRPGEAILFHCTGESATF